MKAFEYHGMANILHLNARKEGPDDGKVLAVDVKLQISATSLDLDAFDELIGKFVYTDIGAVRNVMMGPIPFVHELENYAVTIAGRDYTGARLRKFSVQPADGWLAQITLLVSFQPNSNELAILAEHLQDEVGVVFRPETGDLLAEQPGQ